MKKNQDPEKRKRGKKEKASGDSNIRVKRKEEIKIRIEKGIRRRRQCRKRWKFQPKRTNEIKFK